MQLIHVLFDAHMQYKYEGENFDQKLLHEIYFHQKRKGNIYILCACTDSCLSLFAEELRGCNMFEMQTA